ncbi:MAG: ABC transporter permease [Verrucomicrobiae bacterium]|nr:ABC transporter permease [Verrucomicrobiae bacterium]
MPLERLIPGLTRVLGVARYLSDLLAFYALAARTYLRFPRAGRRLAADQRDREILRSGVGALPFLTLVAFLVGSIILGQVMDKLRSVGASSYLGNLLVVLVVRELGPLIPAMLVLGRSGTFTILSFFNMRTTGQITALEAMGVDPMRYLVLPRIEALTLSVAALSIFFNLLVIVGAYLLASWADANVQAFTFFNRVADAIRWPDLVLFYAKAMLFGFIISGICCYHGLAVRARSEDLYRMARVGMMNAFLGILMVDVCFVLPSYFLKKS